MAKDSIIYQLCNKCKGLGEVPIQTGLTEDNEPVYGTEVCDTCKGIKRFLWGEIEKV